MCIFFALTLLLVLSGTLIWKLQKYMVLNKLPGPSWLEILSLLFCTKSNEDMYRHLIRLSNIHGPVVNLWLKPLRPILLVADPKYIEHILSSKDHVHKTSLYDLLSAIVGNGLMTNKDAVGWKADRKLLGVLFGQQAISEYCLKLNKHSDRLMRYLESNENKIVDIQQDIRCYTLDIILEYLSLEPIQKDTGVELSKALNSFLKMLLERAFSPYKCFERVFRLTNSYKTWVESIYKLNTIFGDMLSNKILIQKSNPYLKQRKLFIDLLLESDLPYNSIFSQLKTFIIGGFETTASAISFALFELAKRPDIQDRIYNEYLSIAGNQEDGTLTLDNIKNMTYTEQVIKETLRMYPTVPIIQRCIKSPITIDGLTIPDGVDIIFSIISLHNIHFENPTKFDPERFSTGKESPYTFIPFSFGPRDCIGRRLAMVELKFILSFIVRYFTIHSIEPPHQLDIVGEMSLKSKNGVPIVFRKRNTSIIDGLAS